MDSHQIDVLRARLEEQLRADIELLQEAHRVKLRAFETVWRVQEDLAQTPAPSGTAGRPQASARPAAPRAEPKRRTEGWSVLFAIQEKMDEIPEVFDRTDVVRVLGFTPKRATLFRALDELRNDGWIADERPSEGRQPAQFRKLCRPDSESV
jgi:hypothetical protein